MTTMMALWQTADDLAAQRIISDAEFKQFIDDHLADIEAEYKLVVTPGGRMGDPSPLGRVPGVSNWIERRGGLPKYIRMVAHALIRSGHTMGRAISIAIATIKRWAAGAGNVSPKVRAAAAKALAQWEAMKASKAVPDWLLEIETWVTEQKGSPMQLEYKAQPITGFEVVDDEEGIVDAIVSVTGIRDRVKDNIAPGSYKESLGARKPKGVWGHDWQQPISKTLAAEELMPGDPRLPKKLADGSPWPKEAGAVKVRTQFNLSSNGGREAYSNVKFFGEDQEWSVGYLVPKGHATVNTKTGERNIRKMDLYEYSPVLWGAMPQARSLTPQNIGVGGKALQLAFKSLIDNMDPDELAGFVKNDAGMTYEGEVESAPNKPGRGATIDEALDDADTNIGDNTHAADMSGPTDLNLTDLRRIADHLEEFVGAQKEFMANFQKKRDEEDAPDSLANAVNLRLDDVKSLPDDLKDTLWAAAEDFENADDEDQESKAVEFFLDQLQAGMEDADDEGSKALAALAEDAAMILKGASDGMEWEAEAPDLPDEPTPEEIKDALYYFEVEYKKSRVFSAEQRERHASSGVALPDGSYPMPDCDAVRRALILARSKHGNWQAAMALAKKRAATLGCTGLLSSAEKADEPVQIDTKALDELSELANLDVGNLLESKNRMLGYGARKPARRGRVPYDEDDMPDEETDEEDEEMPDDESGESESEESVEAMPKKRKRRRPRMAY